MEVKIVLTILWLLGALKYFIDALLAMKESKEVENQSVVNVVFIIVSTILSFCWPIYWLNDIYKNFKRII